MYWPGDVVRSVLKLRRKLRHRHKKFSFNVSVLICEIERSEAALRFYLISRKFLVSSHSFLGNSELDSAFRSFKKKIKRFLLIKSRISFRQPVKYHHNVRNMPGLSRCDRSILN